MQGKRKQSTTKKLPIKQARKVASETKRSGKQIAKTAKTAIKGVKKLAKAFSSTKKSAKQSRSNKKGRTSKSTQVAGARGKSSSKKSPKKKVTQRSFTVKKLQPKLGESWNQFVERLENDPASKIAIPGVTYSATYNGGITRRSFATLHQLLEKLSSYKLTVKNQDRVWNGGDEQDDILDGIKVITQRGDAKVFHQKKQQVRRERKEMEQQVVKQLAKITGGTKRKSDRGKKTSIDYLSDALRIIQESNEKLEAALSRIAELEKKVGKAGKKKAVKKAAKKKAVKKAAKKVIAKKKVVKKAIVNKGKKK